MKSATGNLNLFVVPTGVGASVGGFAGDATKAARLLAGVSDKLIVNPNVVNAACFINMTDNMLYVEGYAIDQFCKGTLSLIESKNNKIGVIIDAGIPKDLITFHFNVLNAVACVYDVTILGYEMTDVPVGISYHYIDSGISSGYIESPETIVNAAKKLCQQGANALAVLCLFPDEEHEDYALGVAVDPVAGVESIISHLLVSEFMVPCAHAPVFKNFDPLAFEKVLDPRVSAEYISYTFLPSVLIGLSSAPQYSRDQDGIVFNDVESVIYPADCLGGIPILQALKYKKSIIAVQENGTVLNVTSQALGIQVYHAKTYETAVHQATAVRT